MWMELSLETTHEGSDWVRSLLPQALEAELGQPLEMRVTNNTSNPRQNQAADERPYTLCLYLPPQAQTQAEKIWQCLRPLTRTGMASELHRAVVDQVPPQPPLPLGSRFWVLAPGQSPVPPIPQQTSCAIYLPTSLSFGSGHHSATRLCVALLEQLVQPGMDLLDLGCGSGLLSLVAAHLGARVMAIDQDAAAVKATQAAIALNACAGPLPIQTQVASLGAGSQMGHWMGQALTQPVACHQPEAAYDLVVANVLARVHSHLAPDYWRSLRPGGKLVVAGFTQEAMADVELALTQVGFEALTQERAQDWVALAYQRPR
jgi:ribosomal protein L11 methyltransferase